MAQRVVVTLEDDLEGGPATETAHFALAGRSYEIDLNQENVRKLEEALAPFIRAGRPQRGKITQRRSAPMTAVGSDTSAIRSWARANGYEVSDRGRVSAKIREKYAQSAHSL